MSTLLSPLPLVLHERGSSCSLRRLTVLKPCLQAVITCLAGWCARRRRCCPHSAHSFAPELLRPCATALQHRRACTLERVQAPPFRPPPPPPCNPPSRRLATPHAAAS